MRDTGTSSAQTAGCGHTEIQQGLLVKGHRKHFQIIHQQLHIHMKIQFL